jgi:lysozyme
MIKRFEGYRRRAVRLPDGRWIVGYGHTRTARQGVEATEADADALLIYDLMAVSHVIESAAHTPLSQNQFDALTSFVFNIGIDAFRHSVVLRRLNEGQHLQAACAMDMWRKAEVDGESIVVDALVRRRAAEKALFLTPPGEWTPAPTGVLTPSVDHDIVGVVPTQPPADVTALVEGETIRPSVAYKDADPMGAAAASVSARLSELYPDAPEVPEPAAAPSVEPEIESPFAPAAGLELAEDTGSETRRSRPATESYAPLAILAVLGLALFIGGLLWAFRIAPGTGVSTPGALSVGWLAGVAGVGLFSVAAYRLFERIAQAEEDDGLIA